MTLDVERLRAYIREKLPQRAAHIFGCEQTALALAGRWGADLEKARIAALLHDITKYYSPDEQLKLAEKYCIMTNQDDLDSPQILHAYTAAGAARCVLGLDEEIVGAIHWHTTGRAGMSLLEKILYLADMIEPGRDFPGVGPLRRAAEEDLDGALIEAFVCSITFNLEKRAPVHPATIEAYNDLLRCRRMKWKKGNSADAQDAHK